MADKSAHENVLSFEPREINADNANTGCKAQRQTIPAIFDWVVL